MIKMKYTIAIALLALLPAMGSSYGAEKKFNFTTELGDDELHARVNERTAIPAGSSGDGALVGFSGNRNLEGTYWTSWRYQRPRRGSWYRTRRGGFGH